MWRALYAAIFGPSKQNRPVATRHNRRAVPVPDVGGKRDETPAPPSLSRTPFAVAQAIEGEQAAAAIAVSPQPKGSPTPPITPTSLSRPVDLGDGIGFEMGIVGEGHYGVELRRIAGTRQARGESVEFIATLQPEPTNPYDPQAVVVFSDRGKTIGYLSREHAMEYGPVFAALAANGQTAQCKAKLFGGTKAKPNIGVWLDIDPVEELLARLTNAQPF